MARTIQGITLLDKGKRGKCWNAGRYLNFRNGSLDLRTGKLRDHRADDLCTRIVPIAYDPEAVQAWSVSRAGTAHTAIPAWKILIDLVREFVVVYVLARFVNGLGIVDWKSALQVGFWVWLGFPVQMLVDARGRAYLVSYHGIEVALYYKRQLTEAGDRFPEGVLQDPMEAWQRLDLLGPSARRQNAVLVSTHKRLESENTLLRSRINTLEELNYSLEKENGRLHELQQALCAISILSTILLP